MNLDLTREKRIFLVDGLINISAAQIYVFLQKIILKNNEFELFFISGTDKKMRWPYSQVPQNLIRLWENGQFVRKLFSFFKVKRPSIIHFFFELRTFGSLKSALKLPLLLFLLKTINTKIILTMYNPFILRKENRWQIVDQTTIKFIPLFIMKILIHLYVKSICRFSHRIIVENKIVKSGLEEYFDVSSEKINVINNAVPQEIGLISNIKRKEFLNKFSNKKIILCFGVISPRKGQSNAIKAFKIIEDKLPDHILVIGGRLSPEFQLYKKELLDLINEFNLEKKVFYLEELDEEEINLLFEISDIALFPYHPAIYGSGAFSFALQYNKPSIVTSIDTFKEILGDDGGVFVDPKNDEQLAQAIIDLLTDPKLRNDTINKMKTTSELRSCESIAQKHYEIYKQILK